MTTQTIEQPVKANIGERNGIATQQTRRTRKLRSRENWPADYAEAYSRSYGPYTAINAAAVLDEESLELFKGWLVWKQMTDAFERRVAGIIQEILSFAARAQGFGQAYPDNFECLLANGDVHKPDITLLSNKRFDEQVEHVDGRTGEGRYILKGAPELAVEVRSPSNRRVKEREKRARYFENGCLVVWDIDPKKRKIYVYEPQNPQTPKVYTDKDEITCEQVLPGWKRKIADFFNFDLTAEQIAGQVAEQWRIETGQAATRDLIMRIAPRRFGSEIIADLKNRLSNYNLEQLNIIADSLIISYSMDEWLKSFPEKT